jgi:ribonuclease VapC
MIAVDSSALIAIILKEPERPSFLTLFDEAQAICMSSASLVETRIVAWSRGQQPFVDEVNALIAAYGIEIVPPGQEEADIAHEANTRFGKGNGNTAGLNFGDLFSYSLAKARAVPLLFKGEDFPATDIIPAES